jgi:anti-sigma regulatory factor (Ser/Thr protein kinase)
MSEAVRLTVPHGRSYARVVRLVVGGLAARRDFPYEELEDVQLALDSLLANDAYATGDAVTIEVSITDGGLELLVGPLDAARLDPDLAADADESTGLNLHRLLTTVAPGFEVDRRDGAEWVRIRKDVSLGEAPTA